MKDKKVDAQFCEIYRVKLNEAIRNTAFVERTPLYDGNYFDRKISYHIREALEHLETARALLISKRDETKVKFIDELQEDSEQSAVNPYLETKKRLKAKYE